MYLKRPIGEYVALPLFFKDESKMPNLTWQQKRLWLKIAQHANWHGVCTYVPGFLERANPVISAKQIEGQQSYVDKTQAKTNFHTLSE